MSRRGVSPSRSQATPTTIRAAAAGMSHLTAIPTWPSAPCWTATATETATRPLDMANTVTAIATIRV